MNSQNTKEAVTGGYGSYKCITEFIEARSGYQPDMLTWIDAFYKNCCFITTKNN